MIIAVDTGGTKTLIEAFDSQGEKTHIVKFPTPRDPEEYIEQLTSVVSDFVGERKLDAIAIALPGTIRGQQLSRAGNLGWENIDVITHLQPTFPSTLIVIGNDADIAGLAEMRSFDNVPQTGLYVTLSTGVGTGICFAGQLDEATAIFEAGAMHLDYDGAVQRWEDFASGKNFYERYKKFGADIDDPAVWRDYADRVSRGLQALIPIFEPNRVVIGGSMGTHFAKYDSFLLDALRQTIPTYLERTQISQANHPEEAVINGCYYYAVDQLALAPSA